MKRLFLIFIFSLTILSSHAAYVLIQMDETQKNHLKAYGIAYWVLERDVEVSWLLNYRGGSFMIQFHKDIENECIIRGVSYEILADVQAAALFPNKIVSPFFGYSYPFDFAGTSPTIDNEMKLFL